MVSTGRTRLKRYFNNGNEQTDFRVYWNVTATQAFLGKPKYSNLIAYFRDIFHIHFLNLNFHSSTIHRFVQRVKWMGQYDDKAQSGKWIQQLKMEIFFLFFIFYIYLFIFSLRIKRFKFLFTLSIDASKMDGIKKSEEKKREKKKWNKANKLKSMVKHVEKVGFGNGNSKTNKKL